MPIYTKEENITLAINTIQAAKDKGEKLSINCAANIYRITKSTLYDRINHRQQHALTQPQRHKLDQFKEQSLFKYILDQDSKGFPLYLSNIEDIANLLLKSRGGKLVSKH